MPIIAARTVLCPGLSKHLARCEQTTNNHNPTERSFHLNRDFPFDLSIMRQTESYRSLPRFSSKRPACPAISQRQNPVFPNRCLVVYRLQLSDHPPGAQAIVAALTACQPAAKRIDAGARPPNVACSFAPAKQQFDDLRPLKILLYPRVNESNDWQIPWPPWCVID